MTAPHDSATVHPHFPQARPSACPFDPPTDYRDWQRREGLQRATLWNGSSAWVVTRFEDIRAVLSDPRISADGRNAGMPRLSPAAQHRPDEEPPFVRLDDPEHARQRRMLTADFTARHAAALRPQVQLLVDEALDEMIVKGPPADLVSDFALPVPSRVIAVLLGVPYEDHGFFQHSSNMLLDMSLPAEQVRSASEVFVEYLHELIAKKATAPGDDLLSRLLAERVDTGELTRRQLTSMALLMLIAGHETTANTIALGTLALLRHPEQLAVLRDAEDPAVIARAVEELLRYLSVVENVVVRVATEDLTIGGEDVRAGDGIIVSLPAGNRDTALLPDRADVLDLTHNARAHLAFGFGVHQCLGQNLARMELQVAIPALLRRLPGLNLAIPFEDVAFRQQMSVYGVTRLPVTW
ncbi:cytochrome P450 [Streptacidiphilus fuscans]|uniref:Cytochrome P450 n=1 Tax=Streptacidiphilus fuscans TaxID=2789292 RepID=A0A931BC95_9ACTN|nr:cytochrome P450 [Streptacidiphilus fuscans]MBF9071573.1 cytochrome P450 [Streptacidiphilus fuscans]